MAKPLDAEQVEAIRRAYRPGVFGCKRVGDRFGVSPSTVRRIVSHERRLADREQSRRYKATQTGTCVDCGGQTRYNGHAVRISERCGPCSSARVREHVRETRTGTGHMQVRLYELLAEGPLRFMEIARFLGVSKGYVGAMLHRERMAGRIVRLDRGKYALPG